MNLFHIVCFPFAAKTKASVLSSTTRELRAAETFLPLLVKHFLVLFCSVFVISSANLLNKTLKMAPFIQHSHFEKKTRKRRRAKNVRECVRAREQYFCVDTWIENAQNFKKRNETYKYTNRKRKQDINRAIGRSWESSGRRRKWEKWNNGKMRLMLQVFKNN